VTGKRRVPVVTLILIAANILAAFALVASPDLAMELGFRTNQPRFSAAITGLFLHENIFHLLGNMVFLAAVGAAVELATGSFRFAVVYLLSGLTGVAVHYFATRHTPNPAPLIGASGCIAGCVAYYTVRYTRLRVPLAPRVAISVAAVAGIWLMLQIVGAFIHPGGASGGTSYWSHLGGFLAGILLSLVFRAPDLGQIKLSHEVLARMNERGPSAVEIAARRHLAEHPDDVKVMWDLADAQHQLGEGDAEAETLLRLVDLAAEDGQAEALKRLCQIGRVTRLAPVRRLQFSDRVSNAAPAVSRALLVSIVDGPADEARRPDAILALAALERDASPERSNALIAELAEHYPLHPVCDVAKQRGWLA
jgi:membrane associated rhomboid family serine protease